MEGESDPTEFFEKWGEHRNRYYNRLAWIIILLIAFSALGIDISLLSQIEYTLVDYSLILIIILVFAVIILSIAVFMILANPPSKS